MTNPNILSFDEISQIPLEDLLNDRTLQRDIHYTLQNAYRGNLETPDPNIQYNPNQVIELEMPNGCQWQHNTFKIQDSKNIYFFDQGWPMQKVPAYLKAEDVIGSGFYTQDMSNAEEIRGELGLTKEQFNLAIYNQNPKVTKRLGLSEIPFNKPLERVALMGGNPQYYDTKNEHWLTKSHKTYKPSLYQKAKVLLSKR